MPEGHPWNVELTGLDYPTWRSRLETVGEALGFFEPLGSKHHALFHEEGDTLLVSFESFAGIGALSESCRPLGLEVAETNGWSLLSVVSKNDTWFRAEEVYAFFDQLTDDGFFDDFDRVLFYGAGPCGYAAAAYSVAAPGAVVVALQPQATLDPRVTEWDERFTEQRRMTFTDRYGYAPDMIEGAERGHVIYDNREPLDAMHAALFHRPNVMRHRVPFLGTTLQAALIEMEVLDEILTAAAEGDLTRLSFARFLRARRDYGPYLRRLLARLEMDQRLELVRILCEFVTARKTAPRFRRRLRALRRIEGESGEGEDPEGSGPGAPAGPGDPEVAAAR
ncbi:phosphoadenosine phosphosulfate reductase [Roseivivax sp.]